MKYILLAFLIAGCNSGACLQSKYRIVAPDNGGVENGYYTYHTDEYKTLGNCIVFWDKCDMREITVCGTFTIY